MRNIFKIASLFVMAAILTACQTQYGQYQSSVPTTNFDGQWYDQNGILSTLYNGELQTKTTDGTNTLLAVGTYVPKSPTLMEIELRSLVSQSESRVNCVLASNTQMNCTASTGSQFILYRQG